MSHSLGNRLFRVIVMLLGLWLAFDLVAHLLAEIWWFQEVDYLSVFLNRLKTQLGLGLSVGAISAAFLLGNLRLAYRFRYPNSPEQGLVKQKPSSTGILRESPISQTVSRPQSRSLRLLLLLPIVIGLTILIGAMVVYYTQEAVEFWRPDFNLPNVTPPLPSPFELGYTRQLWAEVSHQFWKLGILGFVLFVILIQPHNWLRAIAIGISLIFGLVLSGNWTRILEYFFATPFDEIDPIFNKDISFYIFKLPVWQLIDFWLGGLFLYGLSSVTLVYLLSGDSISQGKFPGFSKGQLRHLYGLSGTVMLTLALRHWLARYELLYSPRGVTFGASYTDVNIQLPAETVLSLMAFSIAIWLIYKSIFWFHNRRKKGQLLLTIFAVYFSGVILGSFIFPTIVQRLQVQPNELTLETPFIERSIALSRAAFDLDNIEARTFNPQGLLSAEDILGNEQTIDNIRLWDTRPLLQTNRQLQQIRLYYRFPDADIDRYTLRVPTENLTFPNLDLPLGTPDTPETEVTKQQVIIAPRELDYENVPDVAQTWVNKHLVYTHGYGFTLSPVNQAAEGGLPQYYVKDIGTTPEQEGNLRTSSNFIRQSIPIGNPRIYYGELTNNYVMTSTRVRELDYPSGEDNVYNIYDGNGGIFLGSAWRRLMFADYLRDWRMLFTQNFTPETRLLFRRNINERVRAIAPFLRYDRDPYLVTVDTGDPTNIAQESYLHWIIDAYTTSDHYPYSDPGENQFNYIRNPVKIVIDAYNGDVTFYVANPSDPIIQTWNKIFPELFKPIAEMPPTLFRHIRYPIDYFTTQSERLLTYHMLDPQVFYNREDQWQIPQEIYGNESLPVEPYYLIMKLPTATDEEFILLHLYTPTSRNNLIGWLAGRSDGENYGKLLLYQFPKQELVYGPQQIEALINQDPIISQQISLWNRQGSRALQGNLLVIPIEQSLLYVEPLYIEATNNSLPILARVIVVYENRIIMAETLEQALQAVFSPEDAESPAIIRPLDEIPGIPGGIPPVDGEE